jgi:hypothetical protein
LPAISGSFFPGGNPCRRFPSLRGTKQSRGRSGLDCFTLRVRNDDLARYEAIRRVSGLDCFTPPRVAMTMRQFELKIDVVKYALLLHNVCAISLAQLCHSLGTIVPSGWHNDNISPFRYFIRGEAGVCNCISPFKSRKDVPGSLIFKCVCPVSHPAGISFFAETILAP